MIVKVERELLHQALQHVASAISARPVVPILSGIKVKAGSEEVVVSASNTAMALQYRIPAGNAGAEVGKPGCAVIPARYLSEIVRNAPDDTIILEEDGRFFFIRSGMAVYRMLPMNAEDFPEIGSVGSRDPVRVESGSLRRMVKQVAFAASSLEDRAVLTGIVLKAEGGKVRLAATDGIRFASCASNMDASTAAAAALAIVPAHHMAAFSKMLTGSAGMTEITIGDRSIRFAADRFTMQCSLIQGSYPSVEQWLRHPFTAVVTLETDRVLRAVERVALLSGGAGIVGLRLAPGGIELFAGSAEVGDVRERVQAIGTEKEWREPFTIFFNGKYMRDMMRAIDGSRCVRFKLIDKEKPIVVEPADGWDSWYLLTPVRTASGGCSALPE